ncbi:MAG: nitronate monooxygenase [Chitinophagaceae bacterium]|nr:nitronate monooxygenase [Chitinophagaceae bacterium]
MKIHTRITELLKTDLPIIQAGMIWTSGWRLAAAVSNNGGLGVIGSGSMYPHVLDEHLTKLKEATDRPFAVNLPLFYPDIDAHLDNIFKHEVKIVITSAGNPAKYTPLLKDKGITVIHVVPGKKFAEKSQQAGCDAVIAEGFEAGGHNGREETTSMVLIPLVCQAVDIPVIAAGGIATGRQVAAAMALGAEGVQIGSRFVASEESSSHINFKNAIVQSKEGDTVLTLKELMPVRLLKNKFYNDVLAAYERNASKEELAALLGRARAKRGIFEGDLEEGELEIGQAAALINNIMPAAEILKEIYNEFKSTLNDLNRKFRQ